MGDNVFPARRKKEGERRFEQNLIPQPSQRLLVRTLGFE